MLTQSDNQSWGECITLDTFTKWGGLFRNKFTYRRTAPYEQMDIEEENILEYDCMVIF